MLFVNTRHLILLTEHEDHYKEKIMSQEVRKTHTNMYFVSTSGSETILSRHSSWPSPVQLTGTRFHAQESQAACAGAELGTQRPAGPLLMVPSMAGLLVRHRGAVGTVLPILQKRD